MGADGSGPFSPPGKTNDLYSGLIVSMRGFFPPELCSGYGICGIQECVNVNMASILAA